MAFTGTGSPRGGLAYRGPSLSWDCDPYYSRPNYGERSGFSLSKARLMARTVPHRFQGVAGATEPEV